MTAIDLDAIRARHVAQGEQVDDFAVRLGRLVKSVEDVPALIAEIERLRANQRDDLDALIEEQMRNPEFAASFMAAEARARERGRG